MNTISNQWKTASNTTSITDKDTGSIISEQDALDSIVNAGYKETLYRLSLIYQPVSDTKCKLVYEFVSAGDAVIYVDAETGKIVE